MRNKKELWESIDSYTFFAASILLYLSGLAIQLMLGIKTPGIVVGDFLIPFAVAFIVYLVNRRLRFTTAIFCRGMKQVKLLTICIPCALIAVSVLFYNTDEVYMRNDFPIWAVLCLSSIPYVFMDSKAEYANLGIVGSALALSWTGLNFGSCVAGVISIFFAALLLIIATVKIDWFFTDENRTAKAVVAVIFLIGAFVIMMLTPTAMFAVLDEAYSHMDDELRRSAYTYLISSYVEFNDGAPSIVAAENVLGFIQGKFGMPVFITVMALMILCFVYGGSLVSENKSYTRFFAVGAFSIMITQMLSYSLFAFGIDMMFPLYCPLLDSKSAPMNTLYWILIFCILPPHHLLPHGGQYYRRPMWDLDEYIVSKMNLSDLFQALHDDSYCDHAWRRISSEYILTQEQEEELVKKLPLNKKGAAMLSQYVLENFACAQVWERLLIDYSDILSDNEYYDLLHAFNEIYEGYAQFRGGKIYEDFKGSHI